MAKLYWEQKLENCGIERSVCVGICGAAFNLINPHQFDVAGDAGLADSIFWRFVTAGSVGQGYGAGNAPGAGPGHTIGFVLDPAAKGIWCSNVSVNENVWGGGPGGLTPNPVTGVQPATYGPSGSGPITGDVHILGGGGWDSTGTPGVLASGTININGPFLRSSLPSGCVAASAAAFLWNPSDKSPYIDLSNGNKTFATANGIPGGNQPSAFVRSDKVLGAAEVVVAQTRPLVPAFDGSLFGIEFDLFDGASVQPLRLSNKGAAVRLIDE